MKAKEFSLLLKNFDDLPKITKETTYLEICKYPKSRFEEICSRILSFFFDPKNEHNLKDLFIISLLQLVSKKEISFDSKKITVISEDNADGKRLDLLIFSSNQFVVGIENKITAGLYNPLETYKTRINEYNCENKFNIVLSLNKINDQFSIEKLEKSNFINYTYREFFNKLKNNLGHYSINANQKHIIHLFDFIQTLENMSSNSKFDKETSDFFFNNSKKIEELVDLYNNHKSQIVSIQAQKIIEIQEKIIVKTGDSDWWIYESCDLGFNSFKTNNPEIGLESWYDTEEQNPLGRFKIQITNWNKLSNWTAYEKDITKKFPNTEIQNNGQRRFLTAYDFVVENDEQVLSNLNEVYQFLKQINCDYLSES